MLYYGIALPENSPLREPIKREMLEIISSTEWKKLNINILVSSCILIIYSNNL
jgi:ABC-type amino acid transport substrate-binding protein